MKDNICEGAEGFLNVWRRQSDSRKITRVFSTGIAPIVERMLAFSLLPPGKAGPKGRMREQRQVP